MFQWLEKLIIKRIIKRVVKNLPELKEKLLGLWQDNKEEIIEKVHKAIIDAIVKIAKKG